MLSQVTLQNYFHTFGRRVHFSFCNPGFIIIAATTRGMRTPRSLTVWTLDGRRVGSSAIEPVKDGDLPLLGVAADIRYQQRNPECTKKCSMQLKVQIVSGAGGTELQQPLKRETMESEWLDAELPPLTAIRAASDAGDAETTDTVDGESGHARSSRDSQILSGPPSKRPRV